MKNKRKYKFTTGIQQIQMDTPDYSKAYEIQAEQAAKNKGLTQTAGMLSGAFAPVGQVGGLAADVIRNRSKNKKAGSVAGGAVEMGTSGAALGMQLGGPWGAAAGAVIGGVYGGVKGAKDYQKIKAAAQAEEKRVEAENFNKTVKEGSSTDAQSFLAKKGKYKVKSKQPRLIETEGREPIFSPKKPDGTRDLLYYNPNDPTHEEGGVKAVVMPRRTSTKNSLVDSGKMAYGAKQVKVNDLNNVALSQNFSGMPAANAANKFIQPMAGKMQVARQIPEYRRKATIKKPMSHKKENPDTNRIIDPPMLYEMKPPPPRSTFNTKNNFQEGVNKLEGDIISKVVMNRNKDKDFVKRTKATNMFKTWDDFDTKATHKMAYGEDDRGQSYMYPTIMNPNNEAIKVPNQYADYISSEGYKKATGMNKGSKKVKVYR